MNREHAAAVLQEVALGRTVREIAAVRAVSPSAVRHQLRHLYADLDARNMAHAVAIALRRGLIG